MASLVSDSSPNAHGLATYKALWSHVGRCKAAGLLVGVEDQPRRPILAAELAYFRHVLMHKTEAYNMIEALGRSQARRTGANDENVNIALVVSTPVICASRLVWHLHIRHVESERLRQSAGQKSRCEDEEARCARTTTDRLSKQPIEGCGKER